MSEEQRLREITRRTFLWGAGGLAAAAALGGCTSGGQGGGAGAAGGRPTIRIQGGDFGQPSPFGYRAAPGYWRVSFLFDTLLWPDSTGHELPWLASKHQVSADGMLHTLELREVSWHDGKPFTAQDVAFTFDYFAKQSLTPLAIAFPHSIAKTVVTGPRSLEIHLDKPDVTFTHSVLGSIPIIPQHIWSTIDDPQAATDNKTLIGTGPYTLASMSAAEGRLDYKANDRYFLGTPFVQRIEMVPYDNELLAVRSNNLDGGQAAAEGVRNAVLAPFRDDPAFGLISNPNAFAFPLYWNIQRGGALADVRFRRACMMAIDRANLVQQLLTGNGTVGSAGFLPPNNPYYVEVDPYRYDVAGANQLLDAAGYRRGANGVRQGPKGPLSFTLYTHNTVPPALPELMVAYLKKIGVDAKQQIVDLVRLLGIKTQGSFDMLIHFYPGPVGTVPTGDPDILRPIFHSNPPNQLYSVAGYHNAELDKLLDEQLVAVDDAKRHSLVAQIQRIIARDIPVGMLYYTTMFFAYRKATFANWYYTPGGFGPGIPDAYNKQAFVTGLKTGVTPRQPAKG